METISQRKTGGRHRQGDEPGYYDDIPEPRRNDRRDDRPTTRLPLRTDARRADAGRYAAGEPDIELDDDPFDEGRRSGELLDDEGLGDRFGRDLDREQGRAGDARLAGDPDDDGPGERWAEDGADSRWHGDSPDERADDQWADGQWADGQWTDDEWDGDQVDGDELARDDQDGRDDRGQVDIDEHDRDEPASRATGPVRATGPAYVRPEARPRRRRAVPAGRTAVKRLAWVAVGIAALVGLVLAAMVVVPGVGREQANEVPLSVATPAPAESTFGQLSERSDGWTVEIGEPRTTRASDDVDLPPDADRGVVLDVVLTNIGAEPRDTAGWTVKAVVGSSPVDVLPVGGAPSRTIRPGASLTFPVTVPMPKGTTDLQLEAAPAGGVPSLFVGTA